MGNYWDVIITKLFHTLFSFLLLSRNRDHHSLWLSASMKLQPLHPPLTPINAIHFLFFAYCFFHAPQFNVTQKCESSLRIKLRKLPPCLFLCARQKVLPIRKSKNNQQLIDVCETHWGVTPCCGKLRNLVGIWKSRTIRLISTALERGVTRRERRATCERQPWHVALEAPSRCGKETKKKAAPSLKMLRSFASFMTPVQSSAAVWNK